MVAPNLPEPRAHNDLYDSIPRPRPTLDYYDPHAGWVATFARWLLIACFVIALVVAFIELA